MFVRFDVFNMAIHGAVPWYSRQLERLNNMIHLTDNVYNRLHG